MNEQMALWWDKLLSIALPFLFNLLYALIIFLVGKWLARWATRLIEQALVRAKVDPAVASFAKSMIYFGIMIFVVTAALNKIGIETTSFIALVGAAGLAIGLALQGALANFAAGVLLLLFKPFKVGDFIEAAGKLGTVVEIQIFNTILTTPDNRRMIIPNSKITGDILTNFTDINQRRVDLTFSISYKDDIKKAKEVLQKLVDSDPRILKEPKPVVAVMELAESSVNLVCRPWVAPKDYWNVYFDLLEKGKIELEKNGITIPFPQRDVHIYQAK
ncbi:MAG: mechanosensitive ion channel [Candidatus Omnitrophica bacterium]|nr:mechanosensitive ion channel [Candidatus Omnitrophota bacterium]